MTEYILYIIDFLVNYIDMLFIKIREHYVIDIFLFKFYQIEIARRNGVAVADRHPVARMVNRPLPP